MNDRYEFEVIPICHGRENDYSFIFNNKNIIVYDVSDNKNYKELYSILVNKYDYLDVWLLKVVYYDESLSLDTIVLYLDSNQTEVRINKTKLEEMLKSLETRYRPYFLRGRCLFNLYFFNSILFS
jgi:hypothetical protein